MNNYYAVKTKCSHVGKGKYIEVTFPIEAESGKDAAIIGRNMPRVKHDHKYAILEVKKINKEEFDELKKEASLNPYLKCKNVQQQRMLCPWIYKDVKYLYEEKNYDKERKQRIKMIKNKNKINERYIIKQAQNDYEMYKNNYYTI